MIKLIGILIIVVGFALKFNSITIVMAAGIVTGLVGGMSIEEILTTLGSNFAANRYMATFILTIPVVAMLEKNGMKLVAQNLMKKLKKASPGLIAVIYAVVRGFVGAFNVGFGGVAGIVRPVLQPMSEASVEKYGTKLEDKDADVLKGMNTAAENISWFFGQVLFVAGPGILLVKGTLDAAGYIVDPVLSVKNEIPVFIIALVISSIYFMFISNKIMKKYKNKSGVKVND